MKEINYKNLIKLVEKEETSIKGYIEIINDTPILNDHFVYQVMNKEDKEEIRKKLKEITIKCIELTELCHNANKRMEMHIFEKSPLSNELHDIIKDLVEKGILG
jgi:hypothetical protein